MARRKFTLTLGIVTATLVGGRASLAGYCYDENELCTAPCPAENSCHSDAWCPVGRICVPACLPTECVCTPNSDWACTTDCAGECVDTPIPERIPSYVITDLGTLGGRTAVAHGINELGQVVGSADTSEGFRHAYVWTDGEMTDLGVLPGDRISDAWDVNNLGQVVANSTYSTWLWSAFLWEDGERTDLGHLSGPDTHAFAINDAGQIVGRSVAGPVEDHAFLWQDGAMIDLGTLGGANSLAWDIDESGHVVGVSSPFAGESGGAFLWKSGVMMNLGTLGGQWSTGFGINALGQVVGAAQRTDGGLYYPFLWDNGSMVDLAGEFDLHDSGRAINNHGQVVTYRALWDSDNGWALLSDLIPVSDRWYEFLARDINDAGQIVGSATFNWTPRAFLMTPINADFDDDEDTDLVDLLAFESCLTGPGATVSPECRACDINRNGHIDLRDFRAVQWVFTGD